MSALYDKLLREAEQQLTLPKRRPPNGGLPSRAPDRVSNRPVHPACATERACPDCPGEQPCGWPGTCSAR